MEFSTKIESENAQTYFENTLRDIENFMGVSITVHDCRGLLRDSHGEPLLPGRHLHSHPYCLQDRYKVAEYNSACVEDCFWKSEARAERELKPFAKHCWKGVMELVIPIAKENTHILTIYAGTFRKAGEKLKSPIKLSSKTLKMYKRLPVWDDAKVQSYSRILDLIGQGIIEYLNQQNKINNISFGYENKIREYIQRNAHKNIKLVDLAKFLCLSPSRTSHIVTKSLGRPFQEQLNHERMLRARVLLLSSDQTLKNISTAVGINNVFYFSRLFKTFYGKPPAAYRKQYFAVIEKP
ncbi:MAG: helix-turn-helix domain-containing protein [Victivallaceae bacterium]